VGRYDITDTARRDAESLTFDEFDVVECISELAEEHYSHTLRSSARRGIGGRSDDEGPLSRGALRRSTVSAAAHPPKGLAGACCGCSCGR